MRKASKARGVEHPFVCERRATKLRGMQRRSKAKSFRPAPLKAGALQQLNDVELLNLGFLVLVLQAVREHGHAERARAS